ncbi:MAG: CPBP family intramembrane metalloprotease [Oscillospiraceae bacterium]|nr:CPBP family intramembrane metalloprotease [Oscillospiraceae bacterium]
MIFVNQLFSAVIQTAVLTAIPFLWYLVSRRRVSGFFRWLGFYRARRSPAGWSAGIFAGFLAVTALPYLWLYHTGSLTCSGFTADAYRAYGWSPLTIGTILVWAVVQTSLSEEIFFRGFLAKRLARVFGTRPGCAVQGLLFGLLHLPAVWGRGLLPAVTIIGLTGSIGFALAWLSQEKAEGSILYGWMIHAAVNIISPIVVFLFLL